jgi:hypothetical protein
MVTDSPDRVNSPRTTLKATPRTTRQISPYPRPRPRMTRAQRRQAVKERLVNIGTKALAEGRMPLVALIDMLVQWGGLADA